MTPLVKAGADTLILGCTHFPFLRPVIERQAGPGVSVIDTGPAVARQLLRVLEGNNGSAGAGTGRMEIYASGDLAAFTAAAGRLWPGLPEARPLPEG